MIALHHRCIRWLHSAPVRSIHDSTTPQMYSLATVGSCQKHECVISGVQAELSNGTDSSDQQHPPAQERCQSSECAQLRKHCEELGSRLKSTQLQLQAKSTALDNAEAALHEVKADQVGKRCIPCFCFFGFSSLFRFFAFFCKKITAEYPKG